MGTNSIQDFLLGSNAFNKELKNATVASILSQFPNLEQHNPQPISHDWNYLITCASILSKSPSGSCQETALRIAHSCLESKQASMAQRIACGVILHSLFNMPAIALAQERGLLPLEIENELSMPLYADWIRRSIEATVWLNKAESPELNRFQFRMWSSLEKSSWVSASAPTSAGKSYVLLEYLQHLILSPNLSTIVYVVPTRALIQQVFNDLNESAERFDLRANITTSPWVSEINKDNSTVYILTQERLHLLLSDNPSFRCDLLIVDEAQKLGEGSRGILLEHAIERLYHNSSNCKILFACPFTSNPEILLKSAADSEITESILSEERTVNQNLLWLTHEQGFTRKWNLSWVNDDNVVPLGSMNIDVLPGKGSKRVAILVQKLGEELGGNLVYVNRAFDAEQVADSIARLREPLKDGTDPDIAHLQDLIRKTIHPKYSLISALAKRVAFHYGNMPLLVRSEIENLFKKDKIKFLVCTSTLLEGVNLPCRTIFIRGPKKGSNRMTKEDFWNLAGRAGRWGKEFQGNIVCIDPDDESVWGADPPRIRMKGVLKTALDSIIEKPENLVTFIRSGSASDPQAKDHFDQAFSFLASTRYREGSLTTSRWAEKFPASIVSTLEDEIVTALEFDSAPADLILRNPGINPNGIGRLLKYFDQRLSSGNGPVEELLLPSPDSNDATTSYTRVLHRINQSFGPTFGTPAQVNRIAILFDQWLKGMHLREIIAGRERFYVDKKLSSIIRETFSDIETYARYLGPKYFGCYNSVLRYFLEQNARTDLLERFEDIEQLLEFGVHQRTQISFMELGMSRMSAIALSETVFSDSLSKFEAQNFLLSLNIEEIEVPELVRREIIRVMTSVSKRLSSSDQT